MLIGKQSGWIPQLLEKTYLNQIQNYNRIPISLCKIFKMKSCGLIFFILLWYCKQKEKISKNSWDLQFEGGKIMYQSLHIMSGLIFIHDVSWDQKSGIDPRTCTTELICIGYPSGTSSTTICSVSTSLATLPFSLTPRFKYLYDRRESKWKSY